MEHFRDFNPWITFRFFLLILLWVFYGLVPYKLPFNSLFLVTLLFLVYAFFVYQRDDWLLLGLLIIAAICNSFIALGYNPFFFIIVVFAILLFDIVSAPHSLETNS